MTWWLTFPRISDPRENNRDGNHSVFYHLILEVTYHHFYYILLITQTNLGTVGRQLHRGYEYKEVRIIGGYLVDRLSQHVFLLI